jgi:ABC-type sugar transport system ATPase subunit
VDLSLLDVSFRYSRKSPYVLKELSFSVGTGESVAIVGQSGSGKSTIVQLISGLLVPSKGTIQLGASRVSSVPPAKRRFALVLQRPPGLRGITVEELVQRPLSQLTDGAPRLPVAEALARLGLTENRRQFTNQLSDGQQQRVHLAKMLVWNPDLILLDEPFSSLDYGNKNALYPLVRSHQQACGSSLILVTHDPQETMLLCDRLVIIKDGTILLNGLSKEIAHKPQKLEAARILRGYATNVVPACLEKFSESQFRLKTLFGSLSGLFQNAPNSPAESDALALLHWRDLAPVPNSSNTIETSPELRVVRPSVNPGVEVPGIYLFDDVAIYAIPTADQNSVRLKIVAPEVLIYSQTDGRLLGTFVPRPDA